MRPPKKKKKKKKEKEVPEVQAQEPCDPATEQRKKKFPGLSLPDDTERVKDLLQLEPQEEEEFRKVKVEQSQEDPTVASQALNEVSKDSRPEIRTLWRNTELRSLNQDTCCNQDALDNTEIRTPVVIRML